MPTVDHQLAQFWLQRWDTQQERYIADREERFAVIADVLRHAVGGRERPVVVDLGCGPGSLAGRLARELPAARIIGVDADPLLLALGRACYPGVELADADLADPRWPELAGLPGSIDAAVSTTALHWMDRDALAAMYRRLGELLSPGGVFVNGDHLKVGSARLDEMALAVRDARAQRVGVTDNEEWRAWWDAVLADDRLGVLAQQRSQRAIGHGRTNAMSAREHAELLHEAGFAEVGAVWQSGDDTVQVAIR